MAKDRDNKVKPDEPQVLRITDFSGGQNDTVAPALLNPNEAQKAHFVNFDQKGTIQPQKGRKNRYASNFSSNPVAGLGVFYTKAGTGHLLIASGTTIYTDAPHLEYVWDSSSDWKRQGTTFEGDATADRTNGSLRNSDVPPYRNEKQKITITGSPTGGNFKLTVTPPGFTTQTTDDIPYNATAVDVKAALIKLNGINGDNTEMHLAITATGGTFKLGWYDKEPSQGGVVVEWSAPIAYNATPSAVQSVLEAMTNIGAGNVLVTGAAKDYNIFFVGTFEHEDVVLLDPDGSSLTGTGAGATIEKITSGSEPDVSVTGNAGGPWTVEWIGQYQYKDAPTITATHTLTGGTSPNVVITEEQPAVNSTIKQTYDDDASLNAGTKTKTTVSSGKVVLTRKGTDYTKTFDTQTDWNSGTKTNVDTASSPGDIKLSVERAAVNIVKTSQADFDLGTKTNTSTTVIVGSVTLAKA